METTQPKSASASALSSDQVVPETIREGFEKIFAQGAAGVVLGGMAGIVLARGGASNARRVMAGFGGGIGMGSAWTRTSMDIEEFMSSLKK